MTRVGWITTGQPVYADERDAEAMAFAKAYTAARRGGWRTGGRTARDERAEQAFRNAWEPTGGKHGFAGSGTTDYAHRQSGVRFRVTSRANGSGFWGTSHDVERI